MTALLGAWWLFNRRLTAGTILLTGSMVVGTAVKYSTFLLIAGHWQPLRWCAWH